MAYLGLVMLSKYSVPYKLVDLIIVMLSKVKYGEISKYYGVKRPKEGPFASKLKYGKYPVFDVGTHQKIKSGEIQVINKNRTLMQVIDMFHAYIYIVFFNF